MIEFKNVDKVYPGGYKGLSNVNLTIEDGEFLAIIGRSGAGKSTLLRTINKMHPITSGSLIVNGQDVSSLEGDSLRSFRQDVSMIFQHFNLVEKITAQQNVLTSFVPKLNSWQQIFGIYSDEMKVKALEALDSVDILDKAYTRVDQLSGGQKQRVALARTIVQNPSIILADEPIASLDPITSKQVMEYFRQLNQRDGITILLNIHDVDIALEYATRVIGIKKGEVVFEGHPDQVDRAVLDLIYDGNPDEIIVD
ncbi:phosphonate ABC transporter ATP-binding protein [Hutsoniella sourekii]